MTITVRIDQLTDQMREHIAGQIYYSYEFNKE